MYDLSIEYQIDEFMIYCRSRELRAKTLESYEHTLRLFERWCNDELNITQVDQVTESVIRRYITNLQERGKYTFYANEKSKEQNFPERRRDFRKPVSAATINNYILFFRHRLRRHRKTFRRMRIRYLRKWSFIESVNVTALTDGD